MVERVGVVLEGDEGLLGVGARAGVRRLVELLAQHLQLGDLQRDKDGVNGGFGGRDRRRLTSMAAGAGAAGVQVSGARSAGAWTSYEGSWKSSVPVAGSLHHLGGISVDGAGDARFI